MKYTATLALVCICISIILLYYLSRSATTQQIPWKDNTIIKVVDKTYSEGLPHTSDAHTIIMPENAWIATQREDTLRHEMVHISQRRNRDAWYHFYKDEWDYEVYAGEIPDELRDIRPNPDTADAPYIVWKKRWLFAAVYGTRRTLRNARIVVWDLERSALTDIPAEWRSFFESPYTKLNQYEHPHEISAEYVTNGNKNTVAAQKLSLWLQRNFHDKN